MLSKTPRRARSKISTQPRQVKMRHDPWREAVDRSRELHSEQ
jgi:hypothetical protein